jgi:hypothetical protein
MGRIWKAVEFNVSRSLQDKIRFDNFYYDFKHLTIPQDLNVQLFIELDEKLFAILSKNPTWLQTLQSRAKSQVDRCMDRMLSEITAGRLLLGEDAPRHLREQLFSLEIKKFMRELDDIGKAMATESKNLFDVYKRGQKELSNYKIRTSYKIGVSVAVAAGSVAVTVLSGGTFGPFAIVGLVKGGLSVLQDCLKLASSADAVAKLINADLLVLREIMNTKISEASRSRKIGQAAAEVALNVVSRVSGLETTSISNCKSRIELHKVNIDKLDKKSRELSEKIYGAMDVQEKWAKQFENAKQHLPANQVGKIRVSLKNAEDGLDTLIKSTIEVNISIDRASKRQKSYEKAIEGMRGTNDGKDGIKPQVISWIDFALSFGMDIATGIHEAEKVVDKVISSLMTTATSIESELRANYLPDPGTFRL